MTLLFLINICTHTITFPSMAHTRPLNSSKSQLKCEFPQNFNRFALVDVIYCQNPAFLTCSTWDWRHLFVQTFGCHGQVIYGRVKFPSPVEPRWFKGWGYWIPASLPDVPQSKEREQQLSSGAARAQTQSTEGIKFPTFPFLPCLV